MRRVLRWSVRALLAVSGFGVILLVSTLNLVDSTPFAQTDYHLATLQALDRGTHLWQSKGALRAGYGKVRLTPTLDAGQDAPAEGRFQSIPLAGYGSRGGASAVGVHDDVFIRAVALEAGNQRLLFLGADALIVPPEVARRAARTLEERFGLSREAIYYGATHTHASLGGWARGPVGEAFAGPFNPGCVEWFFRQLAAAADMALRDLTPASLGQNSFLAPDNLRNRLVGSSGPVNPEFTCLWICQEDGDWAVVGSYAAHATVLSASVMEFSGDYPGAWSEKLESEVVQLAMFLAGTVASHSPVAGASGFEGVELLGRKLADLTKVTLQSVTLTNRVRLGSSAASVSLPALQLRLSNRVCLRPWVARRLLDPGLSAWLQVALVDQSIWVATPCDFSAELAGDLVAGLAPQHVSAVFTSFNGDYVGYVIPSVYYDRPGYESRTMAFYGPQFADYMSDTILRLAGRLTSLPD